jgi:hypothetical protein
MSQRPTERGEFGVRPFIREEHVHCQPAVHHAVQTPGLLQKARQSLALVVFVRDRQEMMDLSRYRSDVSHLEHEPFQYRDARREIARPELAALLAQVPGMITRAVATP